MYSETKNQSQRSAGMSDIQRPLPAERAAGAQAPWSQALPESVSFEPDAVLPPPLPVPKPLEASVFLPPQAPLVFPARREYRPPKRAQRSSWGLGLFLVLLGCAVFGGAVVIFSYAKETKENVLGQGAGGYAALLEAMDDMQAKRYESALEHFGLAAQSFEQADARLTPWGGQWLSLTRFVPGLGSLASGQYALEAGKHFAQAGVPLATIARDVSVSRDAYAEGASLSLLDFLTRIKAPLAQVRVELEAANSALSHINLGDIPQEKQSQFLKVKTALPLLLQLLAAFDQHEVLVHELLGGNGPRKYLFLLQNNHEMRATGGFIGSYALLDVNDGVVRRFFVDGIFNPDGQLKENIVPPQPIQKISAGWSLHDSNWFPNFPTSAEKAIFFYEKTGGPTVDGVITLTPTVMQKLLLVTGPIRMEEYGLTIDAENFIPVVQEQVEVKYDKEENEPKKILADLSVQLIEKVFASQDKETLYKVGQALVDGLNEKQMLLYMRHPQTQALIEEAGWSGRIYATDKDYLSVIHSNINGYKTDGVIDESIEHTADIQEDGSVIDTVSITRKHNGGNTPYDWWNKVNADYLRVYVPQGSELLSAKGATWEFPEAPLEYERLGFERDADVEREEKNTVVDEKSGTRISEDAGKTVFGAWVYVSPQESVTVEYRYRLPFRVKVKENADKADTYSLLFQKQAGSRGSALHSTVLYPKNWNVIWQTGTNLVPYKHELNLATDLKTDVYEGAVFGLGL